MQNEKNAVNWFDLPATDLDRAVVFYNTIFDIQMHVAQVMDGFSAFFPIDSTQGVGGAVTMGEGYKPSATEGALVYLNGGEDLSSVLDKVEEAGGQVMLTKTSIGENGFIALFIDTEGNRVGLHSMG